MALYFRWNLIEDVTLPWYPEISGNNSVNQNLKKGILNTENLMGRTSKLWEHLRPLLKKQRNLMVSIVVVDYKKSHRLIGTDVLKVDTQKLIMNVED